MFRLAAILQKQNAVGLGLHNSLQVLGQPGRRATPTAQVRAWTLQELFLLPASRRLLLCGSCTVGHGGGAGEAKMTL